MLELELEFMCIIWSDFVEKCELNGFKYSKMVKYSKNFIIWNI